jgi:hypothetical protein
MDSDQYNAEETKQRQQKILQGAFDGSPTPLKDIPTKWGEQRAERKERPPRKRRQRKRAIA